MYVIDRLFLLSETRSGTSEGLIAKALLCCETPSMPSAHAFAAEHGISKATLYRFCARAGFPSFQSLMDVLTQERTYQPFWLPYAQMSFQLPELDRLAQAMLQARQIVFNGDFSQIHLLERTIRVLTLLGKSVEICSDWDLDEAYRKLDRLTDRDVYVHIDANIRLDLLHEYIVNRPYLISYERIVQCRGRKFYCSRQVSNEHPDFEQIGLGIENRRSVRPYLLELDEKLAETLMKGSAR